MDYLIIGGKDTKAKDYFNLKPYEVIKSSIMIDNLYFGVSYNTDIFLGEIDNLPRVIRYEIYTEPYGVFLSGIRSLYNDMYIDNNMVKQVVLGELNNWSEELQDVLFSYCSVDNFLCTKNNLYVPKNFRSNDISIDNFKDKGQYLREVAHKVSTHMKIYNFTKGNGWKNVHYKRKQEMRKDNTKRHGR